MTQAQLPSAAVVIVTLNRPEYVEQCLLHLRAQTLAPDEIVVVDQSPDDRTRRIVTTRFPEVRYVFNSEGPGISTSRRIGLAAVSTDIIVFIDDDAYAEPTWLAELLAPYQDERVGVVGGRAANGVEGEESQGLDAIGRFLPDGTLTGNFAADPGEVIEVDHVLGANMSYRREALLDVGGIRTGYPGTCLREETDNVFRMRAAGWRVVFAPAAKVVHVAGTYHKGRRFDLRYDYFAQRNHIVLLMRTIGVSDPRFRRYLAVALGEAGRRLSRAVSTDRADGAPTLRNRVAAIARGAVVLAGLAAGLVAGAGRRAADRAGG
jgi:GT2 family glycosyltransferase